jgi:hypothetical protein
MVSRCALAPGDHRIEYGKRRGRVAQVSGQKRMCADIAEQRGRIERELRAAQVYGAQQQFQRLRIVTRGGAAERELLENVDRTRVGVAVHLRVQRE